MFACTLVLTHDDSGCWILSSDPQRQFTDLEAALDYARIGEGAQATIEIWQEGQYICCLYRSQVGTAAFGPVILIFLKSSLKVGVYLRPRSGMQIA